MEPVSTAAMLGVAGINALGGVLTGWSQAQQARRELEEKRRQFGLQQQLQREQGAQQDRQFAQGANLDRSKYLDDRAAQAAAMQRRINLNPLADQAAYGMRGMLGQSPAAFEPRDFTRGTMPGRGQATGGPAPMLAAQQAHMGRYTAGAGGMDPSELIAARDRLRSLAGVPPEYGTPAPAPAAYSGGGGGGGGGGYSEEERMLMSRFTPYML